MKRVLFILLFFFPSVFCFAGHIAGGEIYYKYLGVGSTANTSKYQITVRLFRECVPPPNPNPQIFTAAMPPSVIVTIFNNTSPSSKYGNDITVSQTGFQTLQLKSINPCIVNAPSICYQVGSFEFVSDLPNTSTGYIVAFQTCCRTYAVDNIQTFDLGDGTLGEGATYSCQIPGSNGWIRGCVTCIITKGP